MSELYAENVTMDDEQVLTWLRQEYEQTFEGWDFSYLHERRLTIGDKPWDLTSVLQDAIRASSVIIDMDTGGGEQLAELLAQVNFSGHVYATEGYPPNVPVAKDRLEPLGVEVHNVSDASSLPFDDETFDLMMNRHGAYDLIEIKRVLRPGGAFITQQVGDQTNLDIHDLLGHPKPLDNEPGDLFSARSAVEKADLRVVYVGEAYPITRYMDVGALVYYLKCIPWTVPDFSVERYADQLLALHQRVSVTGEPIDIGFHLYMLAVQKPGGSGLLVP